MLSGSAIESKSRNGKGRVSRGPADCLDRLPVGSHRRCCPAKRDAGLPLAVSSAALGAAARGLQLLHVFLVCEISTRSVWSHFQTPTYLISADGGHTWSEPSELGDRPGGVYDARNHNGGILALHFANGNTISFLGNKKEHV